MFDCGFYDADAWVCLSEAQSLRKYDWIEYEDGTRLGRKTQCPSKLYMYIFTYLIHTLPGDLVFKIPFFEDLPVVSKS